jgi:tRNA pseudouridine55 synthase
MARRAWREAQRGGLPFDHAAADLLSKQRINIYSIELEEFIPASSGAGIGPENASLRSAPPIAGDRPLPLMLPRVAQFSRPIPAPETPDAVIDSGSGDSGTKNERNSRIHVADISAYDLPTAMIRVDCSKGTYIRALARDLGEAIGSGAFLSSLRRTRNGGIPVEEALSLDDVASLLL